MTALHVHTDRERAGLLARHGRRGSTFRYETNAGPERAVSVTMPVRLSSYDIDFGLLPIFDMNLPEGRLRDYLIGRFRKAAGTFDDFDLLSVVGRSQIGRIRFSDPDKDFDESVPFQSVDEILRARRGGALLDHLLEAFAEHSGISGAQPKVLIRDFGGTDFGEVAPSISGSTHIVKLWEAESYPELAANEFFCLRAAERAGLPVPKCALADDGGALVVDRFDLRLDGSYRGIEDFCCLNGFGAEKKYQGGYERAVFKRASEFMPKNEIAVSEQVFRMIVLNVAVRNGDAHLKNFAVLYDDPEAEPEMAPVYDIVTTTAYLPKDLMALTIEGRPNWPEVKTLEKMGAQRTALSTKEIRQVFEKTADALSDTLNDMDEYAADHSTFAEIHERMRESWNQGIEQSLRLAVLHPSAAGIAP